MKRLSLFAAVLAITGCVTNPPMEWVQTRGGGMDLDQAIARCDYESSAATQGTDYSLRTSFGQELDRAIRKNNLQRQCMAANGYVQRPIRQQVERAPQGPYDELQQAKQQRAQIRSALTASPTGENAARWSREIALLNIKVGNLERQLGHALSEPVSTDPAVTEVAGKQ